MYSNCIFLSVQFSESLEVSWLSAAINSYSRASSKLIQEIENSDLGDEKQCRILNDRIMTVRMICVVVLFISAGQLWTSTLLINTIVLALSVSTFVVFITIIISV